MKKKIVQIVGTAGGVSDYAQCLGAAWGRLGVETSIVSVFDGRTANRGIFKNILSEARQSGEVYAVIVHFSGYGYARRGLCFWLVEELRQLRRNMVARVPTLLVYHELFAGGPVWSSAFWLQPLQRGIAERLAHDADLVWTNTAGHRAWLQGQVRHGTAVRQYPVFSNVGEPRTDLPAFGDRAETAIVFGSEGTRRRFFSKIATHFTSMSRLRGLRILEIGPGSAVSPSCRIASDFLGKLPEESLCVLLRQSRYGFLEYPGRYLAKSGVMAAYAAHGMLVCNVADELNAADGLQLGKHYLSVDSLDPARVSENAVIGRNLEHWYAGHRRDDQAAQMLRLADEWYEAHRAPQSPGDPPSHIGEKQKPGGETAQ